MAEVKANYLPTPAEIREWCLKFQETWDEKQEAHRAGRKEPDYCKVYRVVR